MANRTPPPSRKSPDPEMNVTPLVDVVLVLLIIFMVVAPALQEGEAVTLPEITKPDKAKDGDPIEVTMALGGRVAVEDERMPMEKMWSKLEKLHEEKPDRKLRLKTDQRIRYKVVRETFAKLQDMGFKGVSLKVEAPDKGQPQS